MMIGIEISHAEKDRRTGVEEACWQIINSLKKQLPPSVEVVLYSPKGDIGQFAPLPNNWRIKHLRWLSGKLWSQLRLSYELWRHPPDLFFAVGQLAPFFCSCPLVSFIHDSAFKVWPKAYNFLGRQYLKLMNTFLVRRSKMIVTGSWFNKNELRRLYPFVAADKIAVAPLAFDDRMFNLDPSPTAPLADRFNITKPYFLYVGRLETKKNTVLLIESFKQVKKKYDCLLVLAGRPGVGYENVCRAINDGHYKNDIIVLGFVSNTELKFLYQNALAFIFPSLYEGFGLPMLEAMACGAPVLAADIPALRETGGEAALYVDTKNQGALALAMSGLIQNDRERARRSELGRRQVKNFSWGQTGRQIAHLLVLLLDSAKSAKII